MCVVDGSVVDGSEDDGDGEGVDVRKRDDGNAQGRMEVRISCVVMSAIRPSGNFEVLC